MAFIMTRLQVGDYSVFKPMFDQDSPGTRQTASGYKLYRSVEDPNEIFIQVEFDSAEEANAGREKLLASGVLEHWKDRTGPTVVEEAETVAY
jgi:heme-degrading monooxygenase HmoA